MQKYVITLLVALFFSLNTKNTFAENLSVEAKKEYYKKITKTLEGNKSLNDEYVSSMEKLEASLKCKINYERMLRVMNDVGNNMLLGYLKHEKIMPFVREYQEAIKIMSKGKDVSVKEINNLLLEHYRDNFKGQLLKIFEHYSDLADIYDRIFSDNKRVQKAGKQEKPINIALHTDKQSISLQFMGNIIIDQMLVLIPSDGIDTPFDVTEHLENALFENQTYIETLLKAYTMTVYYRHEAVASQASEVGRSKEVMCGLLESLTLTGIQAYKIIIETDSQTVAFAQYAEGLRKLMDKGKEETAAVLKIYDEKIEKLKKEIEKTSGLEKELKEDDLVWMEHERSIKVLQLESDQKQNKIRNKKEYNDVHQKLTKLKKDIRRGLFALYDQITETMSEGKPSIDALKRLIEVLDHFGDVFQSAVLEPKITSDNISLKGGK
jgi:hypothetical protein